MSRSGSPEFPNLVVSPLLLINNSNNYKVNKIITIVEFDRIETYLVNIFDKLARFTSIAIDMLKFVFIFQLHG